MSADRFYVGYSGTGTFTQTNGTLNNTTSGSQLVLGYNAGSVGTYNLSENGKISLSVSECVGRSGTGVFNQSGGTNSFTYLFMGYQPGGNGTYNLSGGSISTSKEYLGYDADATANFLQTGGTNTTNFVSIAKGCRYLLGGGVLNILGACGLANMGTFDGGNGYGSLVIGSACIVNLGSGSLTNVGHLSVTVGANSLLIVPAGFNASKAFGSYSSSGILHVAGSTLQVPGGKSFGGQGTIYDLVNCSGTISGVTDGRLNLNNGLIVAGGDVSLGYGNLIVNDLVSGITAGSLSGVTSHYVGYNGTGKFTQTAGTSSSRQSLSRLQCW